MHTGVDQHLRDVCRWWVGPWHVVTHTFHPTCIKPVLFAPGRHLPGHSLPTATVSVLPPGGQVTKVQTEGAVAEMPLPPSHPDSHLPDLRSCLCNVCYIATSGHVCFYLDSGYSWCMLYLVTPCICLYLSSNGDGLSHVWGSAVAKDI